MLKVYTAGYMAGVGSSRPNWRVQLRSYFKDSDCITWFDPGVPKDAIPGEGNPLIYMPRDLAQINEAHVIVALFNLEQARCLGAAVEVGIAYQQRKPIIMIDQNPEIGSLDFVRAVATSVYTDFSAAVESLRFLADGFVDG